MKTLKRTSSFIRRSPGGGGIILRLPSSIILLLLFSTIGVKAQWTNYETKVITDSGMVKGILQKVNAEGLAIEDLDGKYLIIKAQNIVKIKVRWKGLSLGTAVATGAGLGLGLGSAIFSGDVGSGMSLGQKVGATAIIGAAGAVGGLAGGAVAQLVNLRVVLLIDNNEARYRNNYTKLERYSRERYMGPQAAIANP